MTYTFTINYMQNLKNFKKLFHSVYFISIIFREPKVYSLLLILQPNGLNGGE